MRPENVALRVLKAQARIDAKTFYKAFCDELKSVDSLTVEDFNLTYSGLSYDTKFALEKVFDFYRKQNKTDRAFELYQSELVAETARLMAEDCENET